MEIARAVAATARPCEVLVSRTVRDLVAGAGLSFRSHAATVDDGAGSTLPLFGAEIGHLAHALLSY